MPGARRATAAAARLREAGFDVRAIRAPTVAAGAERLRVVLHAHNTADEVRSVAAVLREVVAEDERVAA